MQLVGGARVELEVARQRGGIGARLSERLARVARLDAGEFLDAGGDALGQPVQHAAALGGAGRAPCACERVAGRGNRTLDVGGGSAGDRRERLSVGRIDDGEGLQLRGQCPFTRDEMPCLFHASSCVGRRERFFGADTGSTQRCVLFDIRAVCAIIAPFFVLAPAVDSL